MHPRTRILAPLFSTPRARPTGHPRFRPGVEALEDRSVPSSFEVWAIDQSNTRDENANGSILDSVDSGGTLHIYQGADLQGRDAAAAAPEVIDLGGAARDLSVARTGTAPVRPHMFFFNSTHSHAVIAFVSSGHVLFMDTASRTPVAVIDVGAQAHAALPSPDGRYVIVANQNGKLLHRIWTDYATNTFTLDPVALDLANGTTPSGAPRQDPALRPDNAPICGVIDPSSRLTFVTLRGGGLFVVDSGGPTLRIVNEYDRATIHRDGCGGVVTNGKLYLNSGGPGEADLYAFTLSAFDTIPDAPNTPAPHLVFRQGGDPNLVQADSHGATLTRHGHYLWVADRWANKIVVVDTHTDQVVNEIPLAGAVSGDPAPDLMGTSPDGNRVFVTLRGPRPLTGNSATFNNAVGSTPGVGVLQVTEGGRNGRLIAVAPIHHLVDGVERADPHGIGVRVVHRPDQIGPEIPRGGPAGLSVSGSSSGVQWLELVPTAPADDPSSGGPLGSPADRPTSVQDDTQRPAVLPLSVLEEVFAPVPLEEEGSALFPARRAYLIPDADFASDLWV